MQMAIDVAGFTPAESDELRRAMGSKRSVEKMEALRGRLMAGMADRGVPPDVREEVYDKLKAFADFAPANVTGRFAWRLARAPVTGSGAAPACTARVPKPYSWSCALVMAGVASVEKLARPARGDHAGVHARPVQAAEQARVLAPTRRADGLTRRHRARYRSSHTATFSSTCSTVMRGIRSSRFSIEIG